MIQPTGTDNFGKRFDFYHWSAPFFKTPVEVVRCIYALHLEGKILQKINVIGYADDAGETNNGLLWNKITEAGISLPDDGIDAYPYLDCVQVPWNVRLCEPIQFVFEDGTTLEILPTTGGGARVGCNTIPVELSNGLNDSNFHPNRFFEEVLGSTWESFSIRIEEKSTQNIDKHTLNDRQPYRHQEDLYFFHISFASSYKMTLTQSRGSWYRVELIEGGWHRAIPYARVREAVQEIDQVVIVNGRGTGGVFWIVPVTLNGVEEEWIADGFGISIEEYDVLEYLATFLVEYFDPAIQKRDEWEKPEFDSYDVNYYSFKTVREMVGKIRAVSELFKQDYNHPDLKVIKERLRWYRSVHNLKKKEEYTEEELNELRKDRVGVAVDFYERFCAQMENMMSFPGMDAISFAGP